MIGIIDYGMGNLHSVLSAVEFSGWEAELVEEPEDLDKYEKLVLPGVGAFRDCISRLNESGLRASLDKRVLEDKIPILGICLGMQVMARRSYEGGVYEGLGWIDSEVVKISENFTVPRTLHMGWNNLKYKKSVFFDGLPEDPDVYFVHSYYMKCDNPEDVIATTCYGGSADLTAAVHKENIFCTQFHPEKSQTYGLKILSNFLEWSF